MLARVVDGPIDAELARHLDDALTRLKLDPEAAQDGPGVGPMDGRRVRGVPGRARSVRVARPRRPRRARDAGPPSRLRPCSRGGRQRCATLFVDEAQDLDRSQLELVLALAGERRDVFLVGDDDQTIYAWRLADVRRILGLASRLPGLTRVDLATNHRCPPEVVHRAARLVAHNTERFEKAIGASPRGVRASCILAPDPGDDVARARRLLAVWGPAVAGAPDERLVRDPRPDEPRARAVRGGRARASGSRIGSRRTPPLLDGEAVGRLLDAARRHPRADVPLLAIHDAAAAVEAPQRGRVSESSRGRLATRTSDRWPARSVPPRRLAGRCAATTPRSRSRPCTARRASSGTTSPASASTRTASRASRTLTEAADPQRALEEERRLAYVAWTRARRSLTIVYDPFAPSVFLREAFDPDELDAASVRPNAARRPRGRLARAALHAQVDRVVDRRAQLRERGGPDLDRLGVGVEPLGTVDLVGSVASG